MKVKGLVQKNDKMRLTMQLSVLTFSAPPATLREPIRIMEPNEVTAQIVDAAFKIHLELGPGLLETVYEVE
jgi:hypothetical protein